MNPRSTNRLVLVVGGIVVLCALGALGIAARDQVSLPDTKFSGNMLVFLVVIVAMLILGAALWLYSAGGRSPAPPPKRSSPLIKLIVLIVALIIILIYINRPMRVGDPAIEATPGPSQPSVPPDVGSDAGLPVDGRPIWIGILALLVVLALAFVVVRASKRAVLVNDDDPDADELRRAVAAGQSALGELDDARQAVIRAYSAMEEALAGAGVGHRRSDVPAEFLRRAVSSGLLGAEASAAADRLREIFLQARYSHGDLSVSAASEAREALGRIARDLEARQEAVGGKSS